jgi:hypothetical protein
MTPIRTIAIIINERCVATSAPDSTKYSAVTIRAPRAAHFLTGMRSVRPGISASSARRMKNTMPATTAM